MARAGTSDRAWYQHNPDRPNVEASEASDPARPEGNPVSAGLTLLYCASSQHVETAETFEVIFGSDKIKAVTPPTSTVGIRTGPNRTRPTHPLGRPTAQPTAPTNAASKPWPGPRVDGSDRFAAPQGQVSLSRDESDRWRRTQMLAKASKHLDCMPDGDRQTRRVTVDRPVAPRSNSHTPELSRATDSVPQTTTRRHLPR